MNEYYGSNDLIHLSLCFLLTDDTSMKLFSCNKLLAALLITLNRSGPSLIPPYHRVTITATLLTGIRCNNSAKLLPAAVSPSSSLSEY